LWNLLNPKVTIFIFSIFTQFIGQEDTVYGRLGYGLVIILTSLLGWSLFIFIVQSRLVRGGLQRFSGAIDKLFGGLMVAFGLRVAFIRD
jgi:threonine/homoserine/homoserine lactone efflux protein